MSPPHAKPFHLGVLFVHGIGNQARGETVTEFGTPLIDWQQRRGAQVGTTVDLGRTALRGGLARFDLTLTTRQIQRRWLLAESCWADVFAPARFRDVAR